MAALTTTHNAIHYLQGLRGKMLTVYQAHYDQLLRANLTELPEVQNELRELRIAIGQYAADLQKADPRLNIRPEFVKRYSRIVYNIHELDRYLSPSNMAGRH